jgi:hypothetical protein
MVFWDQSQNQLTKVSKTSGLSHHDHDHSSLSFQFFSFEVLFRTLVTQLVLALRFNYALMQ